MNVNSSLVQRMQRVRLYCQNHSMSIFQYMVSLAYSQFLHQWEKFKRMLRVCLIDKKNRKNLLNNGATIISINCNGCTISHDLGMRFNSPFVNLWLYPEDFLKYCENMDYYNDQKLSFVKEDGIDYPVGVLDDIRIYFMHYLSEESAKSKWETRKQRMNKNNLYFMMTDQEGCTVEQMKRFDNLPYQNKVIFTHLPMNDIKSSFYIRGFEKEKCVGKLNSWTSFWSLKKYYDQFDYVKWLNHKM